MRRRKRSFKHFLSQRLSSVDYSLLPRKAKMIGNVALIRFPDNLERYQEEIGEAVLEFYPSARSVIRITGIKGPTRKPVVELIAGDKNTVVVHKEHGCAYRLDAAQLMFCLGNSLERMRTATRARSWETVVDMFAGVGQFSIPVAVLSNPRKVHAVELNPLAYGYLVQNIDLNGVQDTLEAHLGDCRRFVPENLAGEADRVIMGYLGGTIHALSAALPALRPAGGVIHFHELVRRGPWLQRLWRDIELKASAEGYEVTLLASRAVKSHSGLRIHVALELFAEPARILTPRC